MHPAVHNNTSAILNSAPTCVGFYSFARLYYGSPGALGMVME